MQRRYYTQRRGLKKKLTIDDLRGSYSNLLREYFKTGFYDEWFGLQIELDLQLDF
ncbi:hypothetical protein MASR1M36_07820 [Candidatus Cloacimonadaceae bacterium]